MISFQIPRPNDLHSHLRNNSISPLAISHASSQFRHILAMPNLVPPVNNVAEAKAYQKYLYDNTPPQRNVKYLIPLYLTKNLTPTELKKAAQTDFIPGVKLYPEGVTTNSISGITKLEEASEQLKIMEELGLIFLFHGETPDPDMDLMDREADFFNTTFQWLLENFPNLKMVFEHLTTATLANYFLSGGAPKNVGATITPHHLKLAFTEHPSERQNGHHHCYPVIKTPEDRAALRKLATSGHPRVFAGTDSAPHRRKDKEKAKPHGGVYNHDFAVSHYAEVFHEEINLENLESQAIFGNFMSRNGALFYNVEQSKELITISQKVVEVPAAYPLSDGSELVPLNAGESLEWVVES